MKKFYMALAAIGLLASCSKENVEPQPKPQEQDNVEAPVPADTPAGDASNTVRLSFQGDLEPFEIANEGLNGESLQGARTVETSVGHDQPVVGGKAKFINFKIQASGTNDDGSAKTTAPALMYLYDSEGQVSFWRELNVSEDGKSVSHELDLNVLKAKLGGTQQTNFQRMLNKNMRGVKMSIILGFDKGKLGFTNKGARLVTFGNGKVTQLPSDFVMLKSEGNEIELRQGDDRDRPNELRIKDNKRIKLSMQGYLIGVRFRNSFPEKVYRMGWDNKNADPHHLDANGNRVSRYDRDKFGFAKRPALEINLYLSGGSRMGVPQTLSAAYATKLSLDNSAGKIKVEPEYVGTYKNELNVNTPGLEKETSASSTRYKVTNIGTTGMLEIPVDHSRTANKLNEGEQFVLIYCPIPHEFGSIAWKPVSWYFYDGSTFSKQYKGNEYKYYRVQEKNNVIVKRRDTGDGTGRPSWNRQQKADGKVYLPMFEIAPEERSSGLPLAKTDEHVRAYQARLSKLVPTK